MIECKLTPGLTEQKRMNTLQKNRVWLRTMPAYSGTYILNIDRLDLLCDDRIKMNEQIRIIALIEKIHIRHMIYII